MAVILETDKAFLRELLLNDVEPLTTLFSQPGAFQQPLNQSPRAFIAAQQDTYRTKGIGVWAAVHREAGIVVGYAGLRPSEEGVSELFCVIEPTYRGNGLGEELARAILRHAFDALHHERVLASVFPGDAPAKRLADKLGFELEREEQDRFLYSLRAGSPT